MKHWPHIQVHKNLIYQLPTRSTTYTPTTARPRSVAFKDLDNTKVSSAHVRAMLVAGSGFFVDSYDNFVIGVIVPMIAWEYFKQGMSFAILGDILDRKKVHGVMILIVGALLCAVAVWPVDGNADNVLIMLAVWRFVLGVGVGGDYPVSAVITSEFASSDRRGQFISIVFAMQGFGIIMGAVMAMILLSIIQTPIVADPINIGYCWRLMAG
ncbi:hypothetical protein DYB36_012766, partial [Aphanomyces astaci]